MPFCSLFRYDAFNTNRLIVFSFFANVTEPSVPASEVPGAPGGGQLLRREPLQEPVGAVSVPA